MTKQKTYTSSQREKGLIELIKDSKKLKFDSPVIKNYELQLREIQKEIKKEKDKAKKFNSNTKKQQEQILELKKQIKKLKEKKW